MNDRDPFVASAAEILARAQSDLTLGLPIVVVDGAVKWLFVAAELVSQERFTAMLSDGQGQLILTKRRAETLRIRVYDGELVRLSLSPGTPLSKVGAIIDPSGDLETPMKGPFDPLRGGEIGAQLLAMQVVRQSKLLPALIACPIAKAPAHASVINVEDADMDPTNRLRRSIAARLPIAASPKTRLHVFRPQSSGAEHYAVEIGKPDRDAPVLTRIHSACFTGDVLGSLKCDCGAQLDAALAQMAAEGGGTLLYLNQEGRGIGLANKMRAYALQDQGFDTVEANHRLGFDDDERNFGLAAAILHELRIGRVRLMTNNPRKVATLTEHGIDVTERVPLWVGETPFNRDYLTAKMRRSGHLE